MSNTAEVDTVAVRRVVEFQFRLRFCIVGRRLKVGWFAAQICVALSLTAPPVASQDTTTIVPGDARVGGAKLQPYTRRYAVYATPSTQGSDGIVGHVGTLRETVELILLDGDTMVLQIREIDLGGRGVELDSITLDRHTLAPLVWRISQPGENYHGGVVFKGTKVSHFGVLANDSFDSLFPRPAFFEGTEPLLLPSLVGSPWLAAPVKVSMLGYDETEQLFTSDDATVRVVPSAPPMVKRDTAGIAVVSFGSLTFWVRKNSGETVEWEEPPGEGGFILRFVLVDP